MKVSVLIPFYNVSSYIERSLISVLNQTYSEVECVLVDDGSSDDSYFKVLSIKENHSRGNIINLFRHDKNKGIAEARNTCISKATGDYILFLDSDDELPLHAVEEMTKIAETKKVDLVIGDFSVINGNRSNFPSIQLLSTNEIYNNYQAINAFLQMKVTDMPCVKLVRRKVLVDSNLFFFPGIVHEDTLWVFSLMKNIQSMAVTDALCYMYYFRPGSITQQKSDRNFISLLIVIQKIIKQSLEENLFSKYDNLIPYIYNLRYYMFKEMIKLDFHKDYVLDKFNMVDRYIDLIPKRYRKLSTFSTFFKSILFKLPFFISVNIVRMVILIRK